MSNPQLDELKAKEDQRRLSREEFLTPRKIERWETIEGLGGDVKLRTLSFETRRRLKKECGHGTPQWDDDQFTLRVIVESVVEPQLTMEDVQQLQQQDGEVIDEISMKITLLNMMGRNEELKKESS